VNSSSQSPHGLRFGIFEIDLDARELRKNGLSVKLQDQPFKILVAIVCRAGKVISRADLYSELSSHSTYDFKHGLNNAIQKIREVLDDSPENSRFIKTIPNHGYRFLPEVEFVYELPVLGINRTPVAEEGRSGAPIAELSLVPAGICGPEPTPNVLLTAPPPEITTAGTGTRKRWRLRLGVAVLLIIAGFSAYLYHVWNSRPLNGKLMLIVVPFLNISGDPGKEYVADGMTEEMITELSRLNPQRLGVIARTTSMRYKGTNKDTAQIMNERLVNYLLEGSVRHESNRVRVTAQLIQASDQAHIWARSYDGDPSDVLKMQKAVARAIADEIQITISKQVQEHLDAGSSVKPEAQLAYFRGLQDLALRTKDGQLAAIGHFKESIALDPYYAAAYAGLARAYSIAPVTRAAPPAESFRQAADAAAHALALDDTLADPHSYLGFAKAHWEFDWPGAEREFRKALDRDPNSSIAHIYFAHSYLTPMGKHDEAIAEIKRGLELDPLSPTIPSFLGRTYMVARHYDDALTQLKRVGDMDPNIAINHERLAQLYAHLRRYAEAIAEETKARVFSGESLQKAEAHRRVLMETFRSDGARGYWLKELEFANEDENPPEAYVTPFGKAIIYAELGEKGKALDWLETAYAERDLFMTELAVIEEFGSLHQEPRFQSLLRRTGLGK